MTLAWTLHAEAPAEDLDAISEGVFAHGRAQAVGGEARPIACLARDRGRLVAGGSGRTEFARLFVGFLWVAEDRRGQGIARRILQELEAEAVRRGCRDAIIETLDDTVAEMYEHLGYQTIARVPRYVGPFHRHILVKPALAPPSAA